MHLQSVQVQQLVIKGRRTLRTGTLVSVSVLLAGCFAAPSSLQLKPESHLPEKWQATATQTPVATPDNQANTDTNADTGTDSTSANDSFTTSVNDSSTDTLTDKGTQASWVAAFEQTQLSELITEAWDNNRDLTVSATSLEGNALNLDIAGAALYPQVSGSLDVDRDQGDETEFSSGLSASWDVDLWGQLSVAEKQAELSYAAALASYQQQKTQLAASVGQTWFQLQEAEALLKLNQSRSDTLRENLEIIESGYKAGLNEALDLYLARNDLNAQLAKVASQTQSVFEIRRQLESLLGRYPKGMIHAQSDINIPDAVLAPVGVPSEALLARPDLHKGWLDVLAADAALAQSHLSRYPSFDLSASYGGSSNKLRDIVSAGTLAWSLGASLTANLFDGGEKEARQAQAEVERRAAEQTYLSALYQAFSDVENALSNRQSIAEQLAAFKSAEANALRAESLAFERYKRGLEDYDTVLTAQRRSLDAQTSLISLKREALVNYVDLYVALGSPVDSLIQ